MMIEFDILGSWKKSLTTTWDVCFTHPLNNKVNDHFPSTGWVFCRISGNLPRKNLGWNKPPPDFFSGLQRFFQAWVQQKTVSDGIWFCVFHLKKKTAFFTKGIRSDQYHEPAFQKAILSQAYEERVWSVEATRWGEGKVPPRVPWNTRSILVWRKHILKWCWVVRMAIATLFDYWRGHSISLFRCLNPTILNVNDFKCLWKLSTS